MTEPVPEPLQSFDAVSHALAEPLGRIDGLLSIYRSRRTAGQVLPSVLEALRVELTYNSNAIEGNTLTLRETQAVIEGRSPPRERPLRELYEARNHDRALRMVERWAESGRATEPLGERALLEVHEQVRADIDPDGAGRLRSHRLLITGTGFVPPGSHRFDALLPALFGVANHPVAHPVVRAAELH